MSIRTFDHDRWLRLTATTQLRLLPLEDASWKRAASNIVDTLTDITYDDYKGFEVLCFDYQDSDA